MILHSSAQLIFGETTATVQTTSRVSGDVKVVGRRLCERERDWRWRHLSGLPGYLPATGSVGASGAHRRARGISRIMGGQDGARARKGTMTVAIKRPETITYEEKNGQKPLNMKKIARIKK